MSFVSRVRSWGWGKTFLYLFGLSMIVLAGLFVYQVIVYYQGIRAGKPNPLVEQALQSSLSKKSANGDVRLEDVVRLTSRQTGALGKPGAKLTMVEFVDFDCPYSRKSFDAVREMVAKYQDQIYFVVRDFPIEELHPRAIPSALAARCAEAQGKFWPFHDKLYINQDKHEDVDLFRYAREVGLNMPVFENCYKSKQFSEAVQQDVREGLQSGVQGTPTFFFNGIKIQGALDAATLEFLIKRFLQV